MRRSVLVAVAALLLVGCSTPTDPTPPRTTPTPTTPTTPEPTTSSTPTAPAGGAAADALAALPVKGRAARTGYDRAAFGQAWSDATGATWSFDGCDQRNDVLARDLDDVTFTPGTGDCAVATGTLHDPYSGAAVGYVRGGGGDVQVDHVVALSNAWQTGAQLLDAGTRARLANDPLNLVTTEGGLNAAKGDGDAATWLPPRRQVRCAYVARQVAVKAGYGLWVTPAEAEALRRVLAACPGQPLPTDATSRLVPGPGPTGLRPATPDPAGPSDPRFPSCRAATAAGYGPYRTGVDPEASWYRDGDGDGVVCE